MSNIKKIRLNLYNFCFDKQKNHLGFKYNNILYCLTHSQCGNSFVVPISELHMKTKSNKKQYLKPALNQKAKLVNTTSMFINLDYVMQNINSLRINF